MVSIETHIYVVVNLISMASVSFLWKMDNLQVTKWACKCYKYTYPLLSGSLSMCTYHVCV